MTDRQTDTYMHTYKHRERNTERYRHKHTERRRQREIYTQRETGTKRQRQMDRELLQFACYIRDDEMLRCYK